MNATSLQTAPDLLTVGSTRFARTNALLVSSLFNPSGTASGVYSVRKNGVMFKRPNGEPLAFLVANPGQSQFFVSAFKQVDGRTRYAFALSDADAIALGISSLSYSQKADEAARVWSLFRTDRA